MEQKVDIIELIKQKNDIVEVIQEDLPLKLKGQNYIGVCPFHDDTNPSMSVNSAKQIFKCFSCGTGGDVIKYVKLRDRSTALKAMQFLAKRANLDINFKNTDEEVMTETYTEDQKDIIASLTDASSHYLISLAKNKDAQDYLKSRHIDKNIISKFRIGYAKGQDVVEFLSGLNHSNKSMYDASLMNDKGNATLWNRIFFPVKNEFGYIVAYSARSLDGQTKYINSKESSVFQKSKILYNFHQAYLAAKENKELYLTEGFMDVIALYRAGHENAVALMGTALTENHFNLLKLVNKIVLFLDGDGAGIKATYHSLDLLLKNNFKVEVVVNSTEKDPDELLNEIGSERFQNVLNKRISGIDWVYYYLINLYSLNAEKNAINNSDDLIKFATHFNKYLRLQSKNVYEFYVTKINDTFSIANSYFNHQTDKKEYVEPPKTQSKANVGFSAEYEPNFTNDEHTQSEYLTDTTQFVQDDVNSFYTHSNEYNAYPQEEINSQYTHLVTNEKQSNTKRKQTHDSLPLDQVLFLFLSYHPKYLHLFLENYNNARIYTPFNDEDKMKMEELIQIDKAYGQSTVNEIPEAIWELRAKTRQEIDNLLNEYNLKIEEASDSLNALSIFSQTKNKQNMLFQLYFRVIIHSLKQDIEHLQQELLNNPNKNLKRLIYKKINDKQKRRNEEKNNERKFLGI